MADQPLPAAPDQNRRNWLILAALLALLGVGICYQKGLFPSPLPHNLVLIKPPKEGFQMGSNDGGDDEKPIHTVRLKPYCIGKTEVTVAEYKKFIDANPQIGNNVDTTYIYKDKKWEPFHGKHLWRYDYKGDLRPESDYATRPVIHVSWNDAKAYCDWLNIDEETEKNKKPKYRLPTEAEWEYAACGEKRTKYSWGDEEVPLRKSDEKGLPPGGNVADEQLKPYVQEGWKFFDGYDDGFPFEAPVAQYKANKLGLHDMTGNVWEWCSDWYDAKYYSEYEAGNNPQGPAAGEFRVLRGGSWISIPDCCRSASRDDYEPTLRCYYIGFRLARDGSAGGRQPFVALSLFHFWGCGSGPFFLFSFPPQAGFFLSSFSSAAQRRFFFGKVGFGAQPQFF